MVLQTGGGFGVDYSRLREYGAPIKKTGGIASGPLPLMQMVNEVGRGVIQGGSRRSAIIATLDWNHPDIMDFIHYKDWPQEIMELKKKDMDAFAPMDKTNISIGLNKDFFDAYEKGDLHALRVFDEAVRNMVRTGEPGFTVNYDNPEEKLRNPCGEVVSEDDSDVCNLGSLNLARIEDQDELEDVIRYATLFLLAGTVYSDIPYGKVARIRQKNRRIGLGIMGVHEWLLKRGYEYAENDELGEWLATYARQTDHWSLCQAARHNLSSPVATRAIAPTGTIGILGETTTGIEPIFSVAYKRSYLDSEVWKYQYVVDPTAQRLIDGGMAPSEIEDAYGLAYNVERRVAFQAWVQSFVDMGVSSTINLPYPIEDDAEVGDFKDILLEYLPKLRGITCFPNGARGNQPLEAVPYEVAINNLNTVFEVDTDLACTNGVCGA